MVENNWLGVDLDGTLAYYDGWKGNEHIGEPVALMLGRVKEWLAKGERVKIFTARANNGAEQIKVIQDWCEQHGLPRLEVTATKDFKMKALYDDRCYRVLENTGLIVRGEG